MPDDTNRGLDDVDDPLDGEPNVELGVAPVADVGAVDVDVVELPTGDDAAPEPPEGETAESDVWGEIPAVGSVVCCAITATGMTSAVAARSALRMGLGPFHHRVIVC